MNVADASNTLLDARDIQRALQRMASEIVAFAGDTDRLVLVGIYRRGVDLARRLGRIIADGDEGGVAQGELDITLYRDDLRTIGPVPVIGKTDIPMELTDRCVVIVDDVLYTGRTVRAALAELVDFGRPSKIGLCALIDRGGRELPIQADIIGETVAANPGDRVDVLLEEVDDRDAVVLVRSSGNAGDA
jgi:pyrimidine operon attenuation protein/uracil phosphoribosyltransferase